MTDRINNLLSRFNRSAPATMEAIERCQREVGVVLPAEYVAFLRQSDGGEGFIGNGAYVILWSVIELATLNQAYEASDAAPGLLLIGSDGGGEAFGFDTRTTPMPIVMVPFIGMSWDAAKPMGQTFDRFLERLSRPV